ncbi:hypothetical protein [Eisenibacter elegans]|uniref:hypothetical protein n=1 Tax=Eisenibacter elegans TaxID=997 RepID=UPI0003F9F07B|nr:hypothetical protein [Eisenibacter elegans]
MNLGDKDRDAFLNFLRDYGYKCYRQMEALILEFLQIPNGKVDQSAKRMFNLIFTKK